MPLLEEDRCFNIKNAFLYSINYRCFMSNFLLKEAQLLIEKRQCSSYMRMTRSRSEIFSDQIRCLNILDYEARISKIFIYLNLCIISLTLKVLSQITEDISLHLL